MTLVYETSRQVDVSAVIDERPLSSLQIRLAAACGLVVAADGFDAQAMGYVAPSLTAAWNLAPGALSPAIGAGMFGMILGALAFGPLADRVGRRPVIMVCLAIVAICSLMTVSSQSIAELSVWRLLTGLGLGGSYPNAIALTCEYSPQRARARMIMLMFIGFSVGSAAGGLIAASLVDELGWQSVFWAGGLLPIALIPVVYFAAPESLSYLAMRGDQDGRIQAILASMGASKSLTANVRFASPENPRDASMLVSLFGAGRGLGTVMLWLMFAAGLFELYFLSQWLPTVTHAAGMPLQQAVLVTAGMQLAIIVSTVLFGVLVDRAGAFPLLPIAYLLGALSVASIGVATDSVLAVVLAVCCAGFFVGGGQNTANAVCAMFYTTDVRSTGVSWGHGFGRLGAFLGATAGGAMVTYQWAPRDIFLVGALPMLVASGAASILSIVQRGRAAQARLDSVTHQAAHQGDHTQ